MTQPEKVLTPCPSCGAKLSVPSTAGGKKIRCPKCQTVVAITEDMVNQPPEMVAPPAAVPKQVQGPEVSLGGENTFAGAQQEKKYAPESLGDQATFGGKLGSDDVVIDDDMEIAGLLFHADSLGRGHHLASPALRLADSVQTMSDIKLAVVPLFRVEPNHA